MQFDNQLLISMKPYYGGADAVDAAVSCDSGGVDVVIKGDAVAFYAGDSARDDNGHGIYYNGACDNTYGDDESNHYQIL